MIMITEPWISKQGNTLTQTYPGYDTFGPAEVWDTKEENRPRVMMYTRRGAGLRTERKQAVHPRDLLWLEVNGVDFLTYYRAPHTEHVLEYLTALVPSEKCIAAGDANASHPDWDTGNRSERGGGRLTEWSARSGMSYIGQPGEATHQQGRVIDLPFSNLPFAESRVAMELACGSDHYPSKSNSQAGAPSRHRRRRDGGRSPRRT